METSAALDTLAALSHEGRLAILRHLVPLGPEGAPAGSIGKALGILPNTLSAALAVLTRAGLVTSHREGRQVIYAARPERIGDLAAFLLEDCCGGRPGACAPLLREVLP